jgi:hypothetical protein
MAISTIDNNGVNLGQLGNRNLIINGSMAISQRSTSVSSQTATGYKTVDRFYTNASGATYNQSQQTVTVGGETGLPLQFSKFLRHQVTTGDNWSQIYHKIEDVTSVPTGTVTLSFYAKGTSPNAGLSFIAWQNFGSGGSSEVTVTISPTVTLTSTWQRFTVNITVPSITGKTVGTGSHFYFGVGQGGSTSTNAWTLDITGVQLEVGDTATPFEHRSYGDELAKCQRYTFVVKGDNNDATGFVGYSETTSAVRFGVRYPVTMRASPSFTLSGSCRAQGGTNDTANFSSGLALVHPNNSHDGSCIRVTGTSGAGAADRGFNLQFTSNGASLTFDAEL